MRVLVVEDHDDLRGALRQMYAMEGHEVMEAADGRDAINLFRSEAEAGRTFDLALIDYNLPHYKGDTVAVEVARSAACQGVAVPRFIALTGSQDSKVLGRLRTAGIYELVIKAGRDFDTYDSLRRRIMGAAA